MAFLHTVPIKLNRNKGMLLVVGFSFVLAGCGLSEYEKRVDEQAAYLQIFDEETKALGEPLEMPVELVPDQKNPKVIMPVDQMPIAFFLRPPKGTATKVKPKDGPFRPQEVSLFRYAGPAGYNVLVADAPVRLETKGGKGEKDPPKIKPKPGALNPREFQTQVRIALMDYYQRNFKRGIDWTATPKLTKRSLPIQKTKGQNVNLVFESLTLTDLSANAKDDGKAGNFYINYYQQGNEQAAVIFQVPASKAGDAAVIKGMEMSLKSFRLGIEAMKTRAEFKKRRKT